MSDFITDVEQQYEVYCKIAEEYGFIDLNAKKSGFRCTTKSNEFNAGWIAFTGAIAAMREDQQSKVDELQAKFDQHDQWLGQRNKDVQELYDIIVKHAAEKGELQKRVDAVQALAERWKAYKGLDIKQIGLQNCANELEQALKGGEA